MDQPLVSVVIPAYNCSKTIQRCLDSVLSQNHSALQVVVVDDGSTDDTLERLQAYAARDSRLTVVHQENQGVSAARNRALEQCRGKYVQFVDSDDSLAPEAVRHMVQRAEQDDSDLVIGAFTMYIGNISEVKDLGKREDVLSLEDFLSLLCKYPNSFYYGVLWNKLFRRELIAGQRVRFNSQLEWGEDFDFITRYLVGARRVSYTRRPVYNYVRNPKGLTLQTTLYVLRHPFHSISLKHVIYVSYRGLYRQRKLYARHRRDLWKYMVSFTLTD